MSFLWSVQSWLESEMFFIKFYWHREKITIWSSYKASLGYTTLYVRQNWTRIRLLPTLTLLLLLLRCYMCNRVCSSYLLWAYRQQSTSPISSYLGSRSPVGWFRPCLSRQSFFLKVMLILLSTYPIFINTLPFNLHLDFWKSRSVSNCRKILGPANLDFFLGLHLK